MSEGVTQGRNTEQFSEDEDQMHTLPNQMHTLPNQMHTLPNRYIKLNKQLQLN